MGINTIAYKGSSHIKLLICCLLIVGYLIGDALLKLEVQESKRNQARLNLGHIEYCYNTLYETKTVVETFNSCVDKLRIGFTGDVYVFNPKTLEFIYESSRDSGVPPIYFTKDSVGQYFHDWNSGEVALKQMLLGKNSSQGVNIQYNFDGEPEWLEWIYLDNMIVVQGVQSAEAISDFNLYRQYSLFGVIVIVFMLMVSVNANNREV